MKAMKYKEYRFIKAVSKRKNYKDEYNSAQKLNITKYTVHKCTPQAHSSPDNSYLIRKYLHTLTCTCPLERVILLTPKPALGIRPVHTNKFSSFFDHIICNFVRLWRVGWLVARLNL